MKRLTWLLLSLFLLPCILAAQTTVEGTVTAANGDKLPLAHVHLYPLKGEIGMMDPISSTEVGKDGRYTVSIAEPGLYRLIVTAVGHDALSVPVSVAKGAKTLALDMRPSMLSYNHAPEEVLIVGDWNDFNFDEAQPMVRGKDGVYTYTLQTKNKDVRYQLLGIAEISGGGMRSVNAPGSDSYVYDGGGDYRSVMKVKPGSVTIRFNPNDLPSAPANNDSYVRFTDPMQQKLWDIDNLYTRKMQRFRQAAIAAQENDEPLNISEIWGPFRDEISPLMNERNNPAVRQFAAFYVARLLRYSYSPTTSLVDEKTLGMIRDILPLNSPLWSAEPALATVVAMQGAEDENKAILEVVKANPDRTVRGIALAQVAMNEYQGGSSEKAMEYYKTLKSDYDGIEDISYIMERLNPDKRVQNGREVPEFEVVLVGNKAGGSGTGETVVSKESMKGKYYLIDFWATWCGPCVGEMESLHAAYEKFGGEKFEILSISFDRSVEDIDKFRVAKWEMPWLHAFAKGNFSSDLAKTFEVSGIPKPVLVDPAGKIIATETELRGENLEKTLERYVGDGQASR